ncbi:MAG: methyltransferase domain-containing protein, partial [Pseudomonadota bacterium]
MLLETSELVAYYAGPLGHMTRRFISARLEAIAQDLSSIEGGTVVGHGFATPFLDRFSAAQHMAAVMPESQGAERWPRGAPSRVVLAENNRIPLADESVDVLLAVHSLESALDPRTQLREFWRVLKGEGHLIVVVPNRRGVWARFDTTPFGSGQPYSAGQLERLLRSVFFSPVAMDAALFAPPATSSHLLRVAPVVEKIGRTG